ncbi:MAG: hypothetical protein JEZ02_12495 [Desulfatibacillum sp.]|nr:hypothetical protein [Desulfatibacillum sp.]
MSRRSQWKQVADGMLGGAGKVRTMEERENVPEKACGFCKNFSENAYASDGRGYCKKLKVGSDIKVDPAVYVMEGEASLTVLFNADGSKCQYFVRMELIDTNGNEVNDPSYRRAQRQMEKAVK